MSTAQGRRLLLVHAHPDDESINNGATMAKYAAEGAHVTLVTCTLGEEGEVIPGELAHLAPGGRALPDASGAPTAPGPLTPLARHRRDELAAAARELGVTDHRLLGGPGRFRDSGMMGAPTNADPYCFWQADVDEAARLLAPVIREVRPQVLVTYDPDGGYGHPDHIQAHRVAMRAVQLAAQPGDAGLKDGGAGPDERTDTAPHTVARVYWNCVPGSALTEGFARLRAGGAHAASYEGIAEPTDVPGLLDDEKAVDAVIDGSAYAAAKTAAMRAHATQIRVPGSGAAGEAGESFALSNGLGQPLLATEFYRLADGSVRRPERQVEPLRDLFAGVDEAGVDA